MNASEKKPRRAHDKSPWPRIAKFALLSLVIFLVGAALLAVMLWQAETLERQGLIGPFYYIVLLLMGSSAAVFFFEVLQSYALYREKVLGGTLKLGGPVVVFLLVVIRGSVFMPNPSAFSVMVFVHGEAGIHDVVLRNTGFVVMDMGSNRRQEEVGGKGEVSFSGIPASFRGQEVPVWVEAEGFEPVNPEQTQRLDRSNLYMAVRRKAAWLAGHVQDESGHPIANADVRVGGLSTSTDPSGDFRLRLPGDQTQGELSLSVIVSGYQPWREHVVPNANEVTIKLMRVQ